MAGDLQGSNLFPQRRRRRHFTSGLASRLFSSNNQNYHSTTFQPHHQHQQLQVNHISNSNPPVNRNEASQTQYPKTGGFRRDRQGNAVGSRVRDSPGQPTAFEEPLPPPPPPPITPTRTPPKLQLPQPTSPRTASSRKSSRTERTEPDNSFLSSASPSPAKEDQNAPNAMGSEGHLAGDDAWHHKQHQTTTRTSPSKFSVRSPANRRNNAGVGISPKMSNRPLAASMDQYEDPAAATYPIFPATSPQKSLGLRRLHGSNGARAEAAMIPHSHFDDDTNSSLNSGKQTRGGESSNDSGVLADPSISPEPLRGALQFRISSPEDKQLQEHIQPSPERLRAQRQFYDEIGANRNNQVAVPGKSGGLAQGIEMLWHPMQKWVQCAAPVNTSLESGDPLMQPVPLEKVSSTVSGASTEVATNRAVDLTKRRIREMEEQIEVRRMEAVQQQQELQKERETREQEELRSQRAAEQPEDESVPTDMSVPTDEGDPNRQLRTAKLYRKGQEDDGDEPPIQNVVADHKRRYSFGPPLVPPRFLEQKSILSLSDDESSRMTQSTAHSSQAQIARSPPPIGPPPTTITPGRRKFRKQVDLVPENSGVRGQTPEADCGSMQSAGMSLTSSLGVEVDVGKPPPQMDQSKSRALYSRFWSGEPLQPLKESGQEESPTLPQRTTESQKQSSSPPLLLPSLAPLSTQVEDEEKMESPQMLSPIPSRQSKSPRRFPEQKDTTTPKSEGTIPLASRAGKFLSTSPKPNYVDKMGRITQTRPVGGGSYLSPPRSTGRIPQVGQGSPDPVFCSTSLASNMTWENNTSTTNSDLDIGSSFDSSTAMNQSKSSMQLEVVEEGEEAAQDHYGKGANGPGLVDLAVISSYAQKENSPPRIQHKEPAPVCIAPSKLDASTRPSQKVGKRWPPHPSPDTPTKNSAAPEKKIEPNLVEGKPESLYKSTPAFAVVSNLRKAQKESPPQKEESFEIHASEQPAQKSNHFERNRRVSSFHAAVSMFEKKRASPETTQRSVASSSQSKLGRHVAKTSVLGDVDVEEGSVGVKSLRSAFESVASKSLDDRSQQLEDGDDDTASVKSLKEKFEGSTDQGDGSVSKMRELFEMKSKPSKPFESGTSELQEAFSKFQTKRDARNKAKSFLVSKRPTAKTIAQINTLASLPKDGRAGPVNVPVSHQASTFETSVVSVAERVKAFRSLPISKSGSVAGAFKPGESGRIAEWKTKTPGNEAEKLPEQSIAQSMLLRKDPRKEQNESGAQEEQSPGTSGSEGSQLGVNAAPEHSPVRNRSFGLKHSNGSDDSTQYQNKYPRDGENVSKNEGNPSNSASKSPGRERFSQAAVASRASHQSVKSARLTSVRMFENPTPRMLPSSTKSLLPTALPVAADDSNTKHSLFPAQQENEGSALVPASYEIELLRSPKARTGNKQAHKMLSPSAAGHMAVSTSPSNGVHLRSPKTRSRTGHNQVQSPEVRPNDHPEVLSPSSLTSSGPKVLLRDSVSNIQPMKDKKGETENPLSPGMSTSESDISEGVTLDVSIAEVSGLTLPTALATKADERSVSTTDARDEASSEISSRLDIEARRSEASSSQTPEILAPLISRAMKTSDELSMGDSFFAARALAVTERDDGWGTNNEQKSGPDHSNEEKKSDDGWDASQIGVIFPQATLTAPEMFQIDSDWRSFPPDSVFAPIPEDTADNPAPVARSHTPITSNRGTSVEYLSQQHQSFLAVNNCRPLSEIQDDRIPAQSSLRKFQQARKMFETLPQDSSVSTTNQPVPHPPTFKKAADAPTKSPPAQIAATPSPIENEARHAVTTHSPSTSHFPIRPIARASGLPRIPEAIDMPPVSTAAQNDIHQQALQSPQNAAIFARLRTLKESRIRRANALYYNNPDLEDQSCSTKSSTQYAGRSFMGSLQVD